ncbi:hypothetical protein ElyMa_005826700 [Elysia marginata]|uniref:Ig-like domain-containing protein n=1 Tax=Elysia marginata TaxID=1093978 RepID=A0AAV4FX48_9GAST|nr:hypothetical protein ElyMa_005826700 [Elysia marginata]
MSTASLTVTYSLVTADDAGTYLCSSTVANKHQSLTKSEFSATVTVKPLVSLNVFDLATALAQLANTVRNLERILKAELFKRDSLERQVEGLIQSLATLNSTKSSKDLTDSNQSVFSPLSDNFQENTTTGSCDFESSCIGNFTDDTNERLTRLEQQVMTLDMEMSALTQQQNLSQLGNDSATFCADVENVCVSVIKARTQSSQAAQTTPTTPAPAIPKMISKSFPLPTQVDLRDLPDYPVISNIDLLSLTLPRSARSVMFHLSACVTQDYEYTEAEKVSLEALKVSQSAGGTHQPQELGLCLGYPQTQRNSGVIGRRSVAASGWDTPCVCRPDATLLQDVSNSRHPLSVDLTWVGNSLDTKDSLEVCIVSAWPHDVTRNHAHLGTKCTGVEITYFTNDS